MKKIIKRLCFFLILLSLTACSSCKKGNSIIVDRHEALDGAVSYIPSPHFKPSDAEISNFYNITLSNLDRHSIYAVASNQLVYHNRRTRLKFFDSSKSTITHKGEKAKGVKIKDEKEIISFIPEFTPIPLIENFFKEKSFLNNNGANKFLIENTSTKIFYDAINKTNNISTHLRLRRTVAKDTKTRVLNIWVEDSVWDNKQIKKGTLNKIADMFLKDLESDIYTWLTEIFSEEYYSSHNYTNIIQGGEIHIVLYNINGTNPGNSRILGYYNGNDVYKKSSVSTSNEIIGFYLDAYSLSDTDEFWLDNAYSTIAHEFLHAIVFYQKYLLREIYTDRWLNEMLAMITEDILSNKLGLAGPRGTKNLNVASKELGGRLAQANNIGLNRLSYDTYTVPNYNTVYSFGSYFLRNFGVKENIVQENSLKLFKNILQSNKNGLEAIEYALKKSGHSIKASDLVVLWGKAMILSQNIYTGQEKYKYNRGEDGFRANMGSTEYKIGSINLYNYKPSPKMYKINEKPLSLNRASNILFELARDKSGTFNVNLELPNYTKVEIIVLDKNGNYLPNYPVNVEKIQ